MVDEDGIWLGRTKEGEELRIDSPAKISLYVRDLFNFHKEARGDKESRR